eukprot:3231320-Lingulodinium_polyedra.AAC.1
MHAPPPYTALATPGALCMLDCRASAKERGVLETWWGGLDMVDGFYQLSYDSAAEYFAFPERV